MINALRDENRACKKLYHTFFAIRDIINPHYFKRNMGKLIVCCAQDLEICLSYIDIARCFATRHNEINEYIIRSMFITGKCNACRVERLLIN